MQKKPLQDKGAFIEATKPIVPPLYEPDRLPDPAQCNGAIIRINDRKSGDPRPRLAQSNGGSWDRLAFEGDQVQPVQVIPPTPVQIQAPAQPQVIQLQPAPAPMTPAVDHATQQRLQHVADKLAEIESRPPGTGASRDSIADLSELFAEMAVEHANMKDRIERLEAFVRDTAHELPTLKTG